MRNYFTFGDIDSRDFGVYISGSGVFNAPRRKREEIEIPGRNGNLIIDTETFENIEVTYPAFISSNFKSNLENFRSALLATNGYQWLQDSYNTSEKRQGCFLDEIQVKPTTRLDAGEFDITFNCKPQRFLLDGFETIEVADGDYITNLTPFRCYPIITVTGYGTIDILGGSAKQLIITNSFDFVTIDTETYYCDSEGDNANDVVTFSDEIFLRPGITYFSVPNTVTKLEVVPRWFKL